SDKLSFAMKITHQFLVMLCSYLASSQQYGNSQYPSSQSYGNPQYSSSQQYGNSQYSQRSNEMLYSALSTGLQNQITKTEYIEQTLRDIHTIYEELETLCL
ncbi:hypothetical protein CSKR_113886, partial [Clonorchis sinensis]